MSPGFCAINEAWANHLAELSCLSGFSFNLTARLERCLQFPGHTSRQERRSQQVLR